jgi:hypothetical protein
MMQRLMSAPKSVVLGAVKTEWPYGHFSVRQRTIQTPEIGDFVAEARVWRNKRITSTDTSLSLSYLYPHGRHPSFPDSNRTESIISTQPDELTFDRYQHVSSDELPSVASKCEIVAAVCAQAGIEVVEVASLGLRGPKPRT